MVEIDEKEILTGEDIMSPLEGEKGRVKLSPVKESGLRLAHIVLLLIASIVVPIIVGLVVVTIRTPVQSSLFVDNALKLFDGMVGKVLYPTFTLLIGYIFGTVRHKGQG